jgi:hypothetical protein
MESSNVLEIAKGKRIRGDGIEQGLDKARSINTDVRQYISFLYQFVVVELTTGVGVG